MRRRLLLPAIALVLAGCSQAISAEPVTTPVVQRVETTVTSVTTALPDVAPPAAPLPTTSVAPVAAAPASSTTTSPPVFRGEVLEIDESIAAGMTASWRAGCPVGLDELRLLRVTHHDLAGGVAKGEIIVHEEVASDVVAVFEALFDAGYPIERMELIDVYGGDDDASMAANNTSAFNCRFVAGTRRWSEHAYGTAIDLNPLVNPYVRGSRVDPPGGVAYLDRSSGDPALITADGPVVAAFTAIGWTWGGTWRSAKDYQHFSRSGR